MELMVCVGGGAMDEATDVGIRSLAEAWERALELKREYPEDVVTIVVVEA